MKRIWSAVLVAALFFLTPIAATAHPGGTDGNGGHYNWSTGEYHYHHGYSAHQHYDMDGDGVVDCPYDFNDRTGWSSPGGGGGGGSSYGVSAKTYSDGYSDGYAEGKNDGYNSGKEAGYKTGFDAGYEAGLKESGEQAVSAYKKELPKKIFSAAITALSLLLFLGLPAFFMLLGFISGISDSIKTSKKRTDQNPPPTGAAKKEEILVKHPENKEKPRKQELIQEPEIQPLRKKPSDPKNLEAVSSSCISHIGYEEGILTLKFRKGTTYRYYNVPKYVYEEMRSAKSIGRYFQKNINDIYPYL